MIELQNDIYQKPAIITKATIYPSDYLYTCTYGMSENFSSGLPVPVAGMRIALEETFLHHKVASTASPYGCGELMSKVSV